MEWGKESYVNHQIPNPNRPWRSSRPLNATQHGPDARQQLAGMKGLSHVVVGPQFQAGDSLLMLDTGGEH